MTHHTQTHFTPFILKDLFSFYFINYMEMEKKNSALTYIFHYDLIKYFESCEISLPVMHWLQPINVAVWCSKCWSFLNFCFNFKFLSGNNFCLFFWVFFLEGNGGDGSEFFF